MEDTQANPELEPPALSDPSQSPLFAPRDEAQEAQIEPRGVEGKDYITVDKNDRKIIVPIRQSEEEKYNSEPQISALQMVNEGKLGGPGRGQGRKRKPRAAEAVAEAVRARSNKIINALDSGLNADSVKLRLQAADMALKIEREEALLTLKEDEVDIDNQSKEDLVATLFALVGDPGTEAVLEQVIDLPPEAVREVRTNHFKEPREDSGGTGQGAGGPRTSTSPETPRPKLRSFGGNGRSSAPRDREASAKPKPASASRRTAD